MLLPVRGQRTACFTKASCCRWGVFSVNPGEDPGKALPKGVFHASMWNIPGLPSWSPSCRQEVCAASLVPKPQSPALILLLLGHHREDATPAGTAVAMLGVVRGVTVESEPGTVAFQPERQACWLVTVPATVSCLSLLLPPQANSGPSSCH